MYDLDESIKARHSTRLFLRDKSVPRELLDDALTLAVRAPSNSNIQPWRVFFASGPARDRLAEALLASAAGGEPAASVLPQSLAPLRSALGAAVYAAMGIDRDDTDARRIAKLRNWEFFGAPLAGIVCMHRDLGHEDSMGVGMFLQTLLLGLTARGLDTCVQMAIAQYPDTVRSVLGIPGDLRILCGLAVGYADPGFAGNSLRVTRDPLHHNVKFIESYSRAE